MSISIDSTRLRPRMMRGQSCSWSCTFTCAMRLRVLDPARDVAVLVVAVAPVAEGLVVDVLQLLDRLGRDARVVVRRDRARRRVGVGAEDERERGVGLEAHVAQLVEDAAGPCLRVMPPMPMARATWWRTSMSVTRGDEQVDEARRRVGHRAVDERLEVALAQEVRLRVGLGVVVDLLHDVLHLVVGRDPREREARLHARLLVLHRVLDVLHEVVVGLRVAPLREAVGRRRRRARAASCRGS